MSLGDLWMRSLFGPSTTTPFLVKEEEEKEESKSLTSGLQEYALQIAQLQLLCQQPSLLQSLLALQQQQQTLQLVDKPLLPKVCRSEVEASPSGGTAHCGADAKEGPVPRLGRGPEEGEEEADQRRRGDSEPRLWDVHQGSPSFCIQARG